MGFLSDNYSVFILLGVLMLMLVLGFIAEKTDFGRKKITKKEKQQKKQQLKEKKKEKKPKRVKKEVDDFVKPSKKRKTKKSDKIEESAVEKPITIDDNDWMVPFDVDEKEDDVFTHNISEVDQDVVNNVNVENNVVEGIEPIMEPVDNSDNIIPLESTIEELKIEKMDNAENQVIDDVFAGEKIKPIIIDTPSGGETSEEIETIDVNIEIEEDDVWKF